MTSSKYIEGQRKDFALYILRNRAIPSITDGLKAGARRVLWTARNGEKYKSASLAGATMPIHPHAAPEGTINTLAAPYGNNIPLFDGYGAFGTLLKPTAYGASRYTSVKISKFTKDVIFKDIEIIPMIDNYDQTLQEPGHFLPLIPLSLLNPSEGIAIGFASSILPRKLDDIIKAQLQFLNDKIIQEPFPEFVPIDNRANERLEQPEPNPPKWIFAGEAQRLNSFEVNVSKLPYGVSHEKFIGNLNKLIEKGFIKDYIDDSSKQIKILIKFQRGVLNKTKEDVLFNKLGLVSKVSENLVLLDFEGDKVLLTNFTEVISQFTKWRLQFYNNRYERLLRLLQDDIQKYKDIILAINKNVGGVAPKVQSRNELKIFLDKIGIVNLDYIADLSVYRFTEEEKKKVEKKLVEALEIEKEYISILNNENKRKEIYIQELKEILSSFKKDKYANA